MKDLTLQEFLDLPESAGCPNGHPHFGSIPAWWPWGDAPRVYVCHGNEGVGWPGGDYEPSCGAQWRGVPGVSFDAEWMAAVSVAVFIQGVAGTLPRRPSWAGVSE